MGSSSQQPVTAQTTQTRDPWAAAQPFLQESMENAQGYFQSGTGYNPYTGQTRADLNPITASALNAILGQAGTSDPNNQYSSQLAQAMIAGRGLSPELMDSFTRYNQLNDAAMSYAQPLLRQYGDIYSNAATLAQQPASQWSSIYSNAAKLAEQPAQQYKDLYAAFGEAMKNPLAKYEQQYNDVLGYANDTRGRFQTLYDEANGMQNPYLMGIIDTSNRRIGDRVGSAMSGAGRYGSGQHTDVAARAMAEAADPILASDYQNRQAQKMSATAAMAQAYDNLANQRMGITSGIANTSNMGLQGQMGATAGLNNVYNNMLQQQSGATAGLSNTYGQMLGQQTAATAGLGNTYNNLFGQQAAATGAMTDIWNQGLTRAGQWAQLAPSLYQQSFDPLNKMLQVGGVYDERAQQALNDQIQLYNSQQSYPWEQLARYNAIIGGAGGLGGTTVTNSPVGMQSSALQSLLGGGLAGAGLGGSIFGAPGAGLGALGGSLLGLLGR